MSETPDYEQIKSETLAALGAGENDVAFRNFRHCIEFGSEIPTGKSKVFADAFAVFTRITEQFGDEDFTNRVRFVAQNPNDVQGLYDLGFGLYEESQFGIAAGVLARADKLAPAEPQIVSELVCALEGFNDCKSAVEVLRRYPKLTGERFLFAYLISFNCLMSGDIASAVEFASTLPKLVEEEDHEIMAQRIYDFLARAQKVGGVCELDENDLRGWNYVTTGGILTMLSPYGYPDPMRGRFAYLQDSYENIRIGLDSLKTIVEHKRMKPKCIFALPGRNALIVATAASLVFDLPLEQWPTEDGTGKPGIIVGYDFGELELNLEPLSVHRSNQLLFSHAIQWTLGLPIAPDVVTLQHQALIAPWEPGIRVDRESAETGKTEADDRAPELIAKEIAEVKISSDAKDVMVEGEEAPPELSVPFLDVLGAFPRDSGTRQQAWPNSPVKSARF